MKNLKKVESNELANSILENLDALVLVADNKGCIQYCSQSILRLLKVDKSEVLGMGWWELTRTGKKAQIDEIKTIKKIIAGIIPIDKVPYIKSILSKEDNTYWIQWQDALGPDNTLIGVGQNITENYNAQLIIEQQRKQLNLLSLVAEKTNNVVLILDPKGNIEWVSPSFERLNKMSLQELILKKGTANILSISNNPNIANIFNDVITKKVSLTYESRNKNVLHEIWELSTISPVLDENGFVTNIIIIDSDVTERKLSEEIIRNKNKDITDSINYAKRIQQAKLPQKKEIYAALPHCFVLFKPKDIVSGDFYYFALNDNGIFIAAADCTGHGVSGALMSMICFEKLDEALAQSADVSEILKQVNKGIKTSLKQSDSVESTQDGMDIALCHIDTMNQIVKYAGANRPLWIIRNGQNTVEEIKATKQAIGGFTIENQVFNKHEIKLQQGDTFYLATDGYADSFNGQSGKKLMAKKFKEILLEIQYKTMKEQEQHLENFIENWKENTEQVDDILVIGIRL